MFFERCLGLLTFEGFGLFGLKKHIIKILMLQQSQFANITHLFYSGEYEQGQKQISNAMRRETNNSNLFVNRALFLSQLGRDEEAIIDLQQALKINPRNYIAYFNLFSILTKIVEDEQAFSNLCCSLSCMYLIRARVTKSIEDVNIAISYSHNNYEAHVLRGLLLLQEGNFQQSKKSFQKALKQVPDNEVIFRLRKVAIEKGNLYEEHMQLANSNEEKDIRLKNSYIMVDGADINNQIENKLAQFNKLYIDINSTAGTVTQKVIKDSHISNGKSQQNIKIIYDSGLSTPLKTSQVHPQPGNVYIRSSLLVRQEENLSFVSCKRSQHIEHESFMSINGQYGQYEKYEEARIQGSFTKEYYADLPIQNQFSAFAEQQPIQPQQNKQGFESFISQKGKVQHQQQKDIEEQGQNSQHYNLIYPLDDHMKLKINVLNLQFLQLGPQLQQSLTDVYCIINYNNGKGKFKTAAKHVEQQKCYWNQQFEPVDISEDPAYMKIKIYNKKYKSVRDDFLGDLEVLITTADLLKLPLYSKKGILGNLLLHLQLVEVVPAPIKNVEVKEVQQ